MGNEENTCAAPLPETRGWFALFVRRFFPPNFDKWPDDIPAAKHGIATATHIHFPLKDRLLLVVSGRLKVEVMSVWEEHERDAKSFSAVEIQPPAFTDR